MEKQDVELIISIVSKYGVQSILEVLHILNDTSIVKEEDLNKLKLKFKEPKKFFEG